VTKFTVYRTMDTDNFEAGLSLEEAAHSLLTQDGFDYEIRQDKDGWFELFKSDGSRNSTRGARHFVSCAAGGYYFRTREEIFAEVVKCEWHGFEAMTDEDFQKFQADAA
jgi:hypothetical protein